MTEDKLKSMYPCHSISRLPATVDEEAIPRAAEDEEGVNVDFDTQTKLRIPIENTLQTKVVLLTMLNSDLLSTREVSEVLGLSQVHTLNLARTLETDDAVALMDKRAGQKQEYRFTEEIKSELIQQFMLDLVAGGRVSGELLSKHLYLRCQLNLSPRSIRDQLVKLGLSKIKKSLPELLGGLKKTPPTRVDCQTGSKLFD